MSENAKNAIINFDNANLSGKRVRVTDREYSDIRYKSIYESWRDIVDLSWQIIQHHHFSQKESDNKLGFGLFVDMAEIWELFLRHILRKTFPDWNVESPEISIYSGHFFGRSIIPDIVLSRGNDVMVFDAKWKRMRFNSKDLDRSDLFQIHTYIHYYQRRGYNVIAGGLLYPISANEEEYSRYQKQKLPLFGANTDTTSFIVDGICFGEELSNEGTKIVPEDFKELFHNNVNAFIDRIKKYIF